MPIQILSDSELYYLTNYFQPDSFSQQRATELVAAVSLSHVTEPGDRMAGALARVLGRSEVLELLISGFDITRVQEKIIQVGAFQELSELFGDLPATISDSRQRWLPRFSKQSVTNVLLRSQSLGLKILLREDSFWPRGLDDLGDNGPSLLYLQGVENSLAKLANAVSIVGSRTSSEYGAKVTQKLVGELAYFKKSTVSGGAIGIDSVVHTSSLHQALPTVAVMAGGLDRKYPSSNLKLFEIISKTGATISELAPGSAPTRWRFLQRNRLIAALTPVTVVVEAGIRSGSIRTANNALDLSRELFAVPGPIFSPTSLGTNLLIAEGKAQCLVDTKLITSGVREPESYRNGSALSVRTQDALRELRQGTLSQIATTAGLTQIELSIAISELTKLNQLSSHRDSRGVVHYALKYANRA